MSWSISLTGTPEAILDELSRSHARPFVQSGGDPGSDYNQSQIEAAKSLISFEVTELQKLKDEKPYNFNSVLLLTVQANGHHDTFGNRNISIKVERITVKGLS